MMMMMMMILILFINNIDIGLMLYATRLTYVRIYTCGNFAGKLIIL